MEYMNPADIRYLIIHCSATTSRQDYSVDRLERDHQKRGFETVGYHYYIRRDGAIHQLRKHHEVGAHCRGYNRCSLGICYEGGMSDDRKRAVDTRTSCSCSRASTPRQRWWGIATSAPTSMAMAR